MKERIYWIDSLKFIGIFCIYLGHFGKSAGLLYPYVFSFHVPLFFFISGLFYTEIKDSKALLGTWIKAFKKIVLPYFVFALIALIVYSLHENWNAEKTYEQLLTAIKAIRNQIYAGSLWFLPCLFMVVVYHSTLMYVLKSKYLVFLAAIPLFAYGSMHAFVSKPQLYFSADSAAYYLIYYSIGAIFSSYLKSISNRNTPIQNNIYFLALVSLSIAVSMVVYFKGDSFIYGKIDNTYLRISSILIVTSILFIPAIYLSFFIKSDAIAKLGSSTLALCGTEQVIKILMFRTLTIFDIKLNLINTISTIIYTSLCFFVAYHTTVRLYDYVTKSKKAQ
ncbi:acyltransferase family protein [Citrobacter amalonaticus]|uniref:acyltransferase family protein n=1 Tax=Citrobacter amalonaticus TaxID=35703 RepID=UPI001905195F|nr:acyltransferase family protein [Citrobacter amalonaticus]MBJ9276489.1 acyltransferase family protein [Citrobacter amalonaticus]